MMSKIDDSYDSRHPETIWLFLFAPPYTPFAVMPVDGDI